MAVTHIVGGGLAGLSAAVAVVAAGGRVVVYEAAPQCGGRCRSVHDPKLGRVIDNGNHLMLSGNGSLLAYLRQIGSLGRMRTGDLATFPMVDLDSGERGSLNFGDGRIPWPLLTRAGRPPGVGLRSLLRLGRILRGRNGDSVADRVGADCVLMRPVWEPLCMAVLNEPPETGDADLLAAVLRETALRGAAACRPMVPVISLDDALIAPALAWLRSRGAVVRTGTPVGDLVAAPESGRRVHALSVGRTGERVALAPGDSVIVAVSADRVGAIVPGQTAPPPGQAIINLHFRRDRTGSEDEPVLIGLLGGQAHWLFPRPEVWSVTISAANALITADADALAHDIWREIAPVINMPTNPPPPFRVIREKRATIHQRPQDQALRPGAATGWSNLWLAGDWTDTGLPATMEGAVRSGAKAAMAAVGVRP